VEKWERGCADQVEALLEETKRRPEWIQVVADFRKRSWIVRRKVEAVQRSHAAAAGPGERRFELCVLRCLWGDFPELTQAIAEVPAEHARGETAPS
jgi:hypothetical protein